jgi:hypothetical protein
MKILNKLFFIKSKNRSEILISPKFQLSVINYVVILFTFVLIVFYLVNLLFIYTLKQKGLAAGLPLESEYFYFLDKSFHLMSIFYLASSLVLLIVIYFFGLRLSHRIAGPLYKIDKTIDSVINEGNEQTITLRKNDYFKEHAEKINDLIKFKINN